MKGRLRIDTRYYKQLKSLLVDVLFSAEKFDDIAKKHRQMDGKKIFLNTEDFNFVVKEDKVGKENVTDDDLDKVIDKFLKELTRTPYTLKERGNKK